jgi:hypothetical protein
MISPLLHRYRYDICSNISLNPIGKEVLPVTYFSMLSCSLSWIVPVCYFFTSTPRYPLTLTCGTEDWSTKVNAFYRLLQAPIEAEDWTLLSWSRSTHNAASWGCCLENAQHSLVSILTMLDLIFTSRTHHHGTMRGHRGDLYYVEPRTRDNIICNSLEVWTSYRYISRG